MKLWKWIKLLLKFLGLVKEAEELARGDGSGATAPEAKAGPPCDPTDPDDLFHLNQ